jgi:hypothetical protein
MVVPIRPARTSHLVERRHVSVLPLNSEQRRSVGGDINRLLKNDASFGVIACHDGSLIKFSITGKPTGGYEVNEQNVQQLIDHYDIDEKLFDAYKTRLGVSVERLA